MHIFCTEIKALSFSASTRRTSSLSGVNTCSPDTFSHCVVTDFFFPLRLLRIMMHQVCALCVCCCVYGFPPWCETNPQLTSTIKQTSIARRMNLCLPSLKTSFRLKSIVHMMHGGLKYMHIYSGVIRAWTKRGWDSMVIRGGVYPSVLHFHLNVN